MEDTSADVWDMLRDMRSKFTLVKNLLNVDESNKQVTGELLNTGNKETPKSNTLNW